MFWNFVLCITALMFAIWFGYKKDIGNCLLDIAVLLINLPSAIAWVIKYFS